MEDLEGLKICLPIEKFYLCLRDVCTGFRVLGCLWSISLVVAWRLRPQSCRQCRSLWFKPASSSKESIVPRSAVKCAQSKKGLQNWQVMAKLARREHLLWMLSTSPLTALQPSAASTSTSSSLCQSLSFPSLFHFLIYKQIFSQDRFWYPSPHWEVNKWWNTTYYFFQAFLHFNGYQNKMTKKLIICFSGREVGKYFSVLYVDGDCHSRPKKW